MGRYFSYWFVGIMLLGIIGAFFVYKKGSGVGGFLGNYAQVFWTGLIFLFLLFGVIIISLVLRGFREKETKTKVH